MRRTAALVGLTFALIALLPAGGSAGGADWFEFDRPYYSPGDSAVARTRVWFASEERARTVTERPFAAYLLAGDRWLRPPGVPPAAIPLGTVTFSLPDGTTALATLEFTVPNVPTGDWNVGVCNVPCTAAMIGSLAGSSIRIASSAEMATMLRLQDRLEAGLRRAKRSAHRAAKGFRHEVGYVRGETRSLARRVGELEEKLEQATRRSRQTPVTGFPTLIGWILVALTVIFGLVAFRPRRRGVLAPDPPAIERIEDPERDPVA
jgi:hypothetical protein